MQGPRTRTSSEEELDRIRRAVARRVLLIRLSLLPIGVGGVLIAFDPRVQFFARGPAPLNLIGSLLAGIGFSFTLFTYVRRETSRGFPPGRRRGFATMSAGLVSMFADAALAARPAGWLPVAGYAIVAVMSAVSAAYLLWPDRHRIPGLAPPT